MKTVYLAGKITGDPNYRVKFRAARHELERAGYAVLDPSVLPSSGFEYAAYMRIGAAMLEECESACFLSDWMDSPGAKAEHIQAVHRGKVVFYFDQWRQKLKEGLHEGLQEGAQYATP